MGENVDVSDPTMEQAAAPNLQPSAEAPSRNPQLSEQPVWEMEMVMEREQDSPAAGFQSIPSEEEAEDLSQEGAEGGGGRERLREEGMSVIPHRYECVMSTSVTATLVDKLDKMDEDSVLSQNLNGSEPLEAQPELSVPPPFQVQEQSELFDPQTLQTVVTSCEIPDQRTALEGSQVGEQVFRREVHKHVHNTAKCPFLTRKYIPPVFHC